MTINLSEEIIEIEKTLFIIKEEFESFQACLIYHNKKDTFRAEKFNKVRFYEYYPYLFQDVFKKGKF